MGGYAVKPYLGIVRNAPGARPFRILIAGGGTGDKTLQLAEQLRAMGSRTYEVVHLDRSRGALAVAERRARRRR